MSNNYKIYKHINKINNKIYIGLTMQSIQERWRLNGKGYKPRGNNRNYLWNAIQKYGWDNFEHIVLFDRLTKEEAQEIEIELILFHQSNNEDFGYNIQKGGNLGNSGLKLSEETKLKIKLNHADISGEKNYWYGKKGVLSPNYGKKLSIEHKQKISESHKGEKNHMYGKHHSDETKIKISKSLKNKTKGKIVSPETRKKISETKKRKGCSVGEKNPMYGVHKYGKDSPRYGKGKSVTCIEINKIFNTIKDASLELNLDCASIIRVCKGIQKQTGGLTFKYTNEVNDIC